MDVPQATNQNPKYHRQIFLMLSRDHIFYDYQPIKHFGVGIQSLGEKVCTVVCDFFISVDKDCDDTTIDMYTYLRLLIK